MRRNMHDIAELNPGDIVVYGDRYNRAVIKAIYAIDHDAKTVLLVSLNRYMELVFKNAKLTDNEKPVDYTTFPKVYYPACIEAVTEHRELRPFDIFLGMLRITYSDEPYFVWCVDIIKTEDEEILFSAREEDFIATEFLPGTYCYGYTNSGYEYFHQFRDRPTPIARVVPKDERRKKMLSRRLVQE